MFFLRQFAYLSAFVFASLQFIVYCLLFIVCYLLFISQLFVCYLFVICLLVSSFTFVQKHVLQGALIFAYQCL